MPNRRRSAVRVWVPVVVSGVVQLVTTGAVIGAHAVGWRPRVGGPHGFGPGGAPAIAGAVHTVSPWLAATLIALALVGPALLTVARRAPGPALAAITGAAIAGTVLCAASGLAAPFYLSVLFGVGAATFLRARAWAWSCAGAYWLGFALAYLLSASPLQLGWLIPLTILSVAALVGPEFARTRREVRARFIQQAEARRTAEAQAERVRIARELHDVLAHSLSQINVQASVGLHLFESQPAKAEEALADIKDASKQALGEVRQVLGMLRGDEAPLAPEHGLADIAELVDGVRRQGIEATLTQDVTDPSRLPAAVAQAAYRIAQEALTNVVRHAQAHRVEVSVTLRDAHLRIVVSDDGRGARQSFLETGSAGHAPSPTSASDVTGDRDAAATDGGRGLLGMRERAELLGGTFSAGSHGGGFEVVAELPIGPVR